MVFPQDTKMSNENIILIKDLRPKQNNINTIFIVLDIGKPNRTKDGHNVRSIKVADRSGAINISIWDEAGDLLQHGDICKLVKGYTNVFKGCLTLYVGKGGFLKRIGEFCLQFSEAPNMSEFNPDFAKTDGNTQRKSPTENISGQSLGNQQNGLPGPLSNQTNHPGPLSNQTNHQAQSGNGRLSNDPRTARQNRSNNEGRGSTPTDTRTIRPLMSGPVLNNGVGLLPTPPVSAHLVPPPLPPMPPEDPRMISGRMVTANIPLPGSDFRR